MPKNLHLLIILFFVWSSAGAQLMNHYWTHNFNSTSSLLGGAVVAGEGDNTAIFYNPATISQVQQGSNLSLAANLFTWNFYKLRNALGEGIDLNPSNFMIQPQFVSFTYAPKNRKGVSLGIAALTRVKERIEMNYADASYYDVIERYPGDEKYNTVFNFRNEYSDSWVGAAISHRPLENFSYGVSMFVSFSTLRYNNLLSAYAYNPNDTIGVINYRLSEGSETQQFKFTDYRIIFKFGVAYELDRWKFGLTITTPNGVIFSGGKSATRIVKQSNIAYNGVLLPDVLVFDGQSKNELKTNFKLPWSFAFGLIYDMPSKGSRFYFTTEYFAKIKGYKMVDAQIRDDITTPNLEEVLGQPDFLSYAYGANALINFAFGYSWTLRNDLVFLNAFRTDFSAVHNIDYGEYADLNSIASTDYNIYHYSAGLKFSLKRQRFIAGGDFAFGYRNKRKQVANFSDPIEFNDVDLRALQGYLQDNLETFYFGFSIYIGATLNFNRDDAKPKK